MAKLIRSNGKKQDSSTNSVGLADRIALHMERERKIKRYPLRINATTVIYVKKEKCNEEYAERYRQKLKKYAGCW